MATGTSKSTKATTTNYDIDYNDKRFTQVESDKKQALTESEKLYGNMVGESDKYYQAQIDATKQWSEQQQKLQQENTDFAIEKIEQQKQQAHTDYLKEQSGAYTDWQKQSNKYGVKAEQMAMQGMSGGGYSESSQVSMYNTYQNRVATARDSYNRAVLNYDNAIKDAQLQNNSKLAEIAYQALQQELELSLQGFQYKNTLLLEQANKKMEIENTYYNRYQDVLAQINTENALAEQIRQYNEEMDFQREQADREQANWEKEYALQKKNLNSSSSGSTKKSSSGSTKKKTGNNDKEAQAQIEEEKRVQKEKEETAKKVKEATKKAYTSVKDVVTNIKTFKADSVKNTNTPLNKKASSLLNLKF